MEDEPTLEELLASNGSRLNVLRMQDIGVDVGVLTLRHLIETLYPTDEERNAMNLSFQKRLAAELDNIEANVDAIKLQRSGLIVPGGPVPGG